MLALSFSSSSYPLLSPLPSHLPLCPSPSFLALSSSLTHTPLLHFSVDTLDTVGVRDNPDIHGATVVPGPSGDDAYLLSLPLTGDANSADWATIFSHFPREFSLTLIFRNESASSDNLFLLSDGQGIQIAVQLQRTDDDESALMITFPGTSIREPIAALNDGSFHYISLKLEGKFLSIYVDCNFDSFLKLESTPDNITVTASTVFTLFSGGYVVSI